MKYLYKFLQFSFILCTVAVFGFVAEAKAVNQVSYPGINIDMYLDYVKTGQLWNYTKSNSATVYPGEEIQIRQNTTFSQSARGLLAGEESGNSQIRWVASNCPKNADCKQWIFRDSNNSMAFPWWTVILGAKYSESGSPYLVIKTSSSTPTGTYVINFIAEENPATWPVPLMNSAKQSFTLNVATPQYPIIEVLPNSLNFSAISGGSVPEAQKINLKNTGNSIMNWKISSGKTWCHVYPSSGSLSSGKSESLTLSMDAPSNIGSFDCTIIITDSKAYNNPQKISAKYVVSNAPQAVIALNPVSLSFVGVSGGDVPKNQNFSLSNSGQAVLNWTAQSNKNWCHLSKTFGSLDVDEKLYVEVSVDAPSNIGNFTCEVFVSDKNSANKTQNFVVNYLVSAPLRPDIILNPEEIFFVAYSGGPIPQEKDLTIYNSGQADLNWTAQTNQDWCHLSASSGKINPTASAIIKVLVDAPSNAGKFICSIIVSDPKAGNGIKKLAVKYYIEQNIGNPSGIMALSQPCEAVSLSWKAGATATQYNIYRNTKNIIPNTALVAGYSGLSYIDTKVLPGTKYYYWLETVGASLPEKIKSQSNVLGGISAEACKITEIPLRPPLVVASLPACENSELNWTNVFNENGYYVYRNTTGNFPLQTEKIASLKKDVVNFRETLLSGKYYYWVSSFNQKGESALKQISPNSISVFACQTDLSASDKNLLAINGNLQQRSVCDYNQFQGLPLDKEILKPGDKLTYEINLCNTSDSKDGENVLVEDSLTNLDSPSKVILDGKVLEKVLSNPNEGQFVYDSVAHKLTVNVGKVKKDSHRQLTYEVEIKTQNNFSNICPKCQNKATIYYGKGALSQGKVELSSSPIFYSVKPSSVSY